MVHKTVAFVPPGVLKGKIYTEGRAYCEQDKKTFLPIREQWGGESAEVYFRCLSHDDPELTRPTLHPIPNVIIQTR